MPRQLTAPEAPASSGLHFLEQKLQIYVHGPGVTGRRNPALDVLVGRVPDSRLAPLAAAFAGSQEARCSTTEFVGWRSPAAPPQPIEQPQASGTLRPDGPAQLHEPVAAPREPTAVVLPVAAVRMAAVARAKRSASPWLELDADHPRLRLTQPPPPSRWTRLRQRLLGWLP